MIVEEESHFFPILPVFAPPPSGKSVTVGMVRKKLTRETVNERGTKKENQRLH